MTTLHLDNTGISSAAILHRPAIAIVSNSQTPYRLHLHRRIAVEIPEIKFFSIYTHQTSNANWQFGAPEVASNLATILPEVIHHLPPNGSVPNQSLLSEGVGLLRSQLLGGN